MRATALLALAATGVVFTAATGVLLTAGPASAASRPTVLRLTESTTAIEFTDNGAPGPGVGDVLAYTTSVRDAGSGTVLGTKKGVCTTAYAGRNGHLYAACTEKFSLTAGTLDAAGIVDQTALPTGAHQYLLVAGKAGAYRGLGGTEDYFASRYPDEFTTTLTLR
jgi:hypothetical protein